MAKHLSSKEKQLILKLAADGATHSAIAGQVGCSRTTVGRVIGRSSGKNFGRRGSDRVKQVNARMSEADVSALQELAVREGVSPSEMLRILVRRGAGFVDIGSVEAEVLRQSSKDLNALARNLVQILQLARAGRLKWNARDGALVGKLVDRVEVVARDLQGFRAAVTRGVNISATVHPAKEG